MLGFVSILDEFERVDVAVDESVRKVASELVRSGVVQNQKLGHFLLKADHAPAHFILEVLAVYPGDIIRHLFLPPMQLLFPPVVNFLVGRIEG